VGLKYWLENGCMEGGHHILIGPPWTKTSSASSVREGTPVNQKIAKWRRWLDDIEKQICWDLLFKRNRSYAVDSASLSAYDHTRRFFNGRGKG